MIVLFRAHCRFPSMLGGMLLLSACSTSSFKIESEPTGAVVTNEANEELGKTPLSLEGTLLEKAQSGKSFVVFTISKPGYESAKLYVEPKKFDELTIKLSSQNEKTFQYRILKDYGPQTHLMIGQFLKAQGLMGVRQYDQASKIVDAIQKDYPQVAASYALAADLALAKRDKERAISLLVQAAKLAPEDGDIKQGLERLGVKP